MSRWSTFSVHRRLADDVREELFDRIRSRIEQGGGSVTADVVDVLYVASVA